MATLEIDNMEYSSDESAQTAYVTNASGGYGSELVSNGTAWTGATDNTPPNNWTSPNPTQGTFTIESGTLKMACVTGNPVIRQTVTVEVGKTYLISVDIKNGNLSNGMVVGFGTTEGSNQIGAHVETGTSVFVTHTTQWTATQTSLYLSANTDAVGAQYGYIDNYSVKEITTPALQSYSEATIKTQGSYSLKGIAAITDSLNKTLTKTLSPVSNLTGVKNLKFDIRASRTGSNIKIGLHDSGGTTTEITPNIITADTFQTVNFDLSTVSDANKDAIDSIIVTILNADAANTFYIDWLEIATCIDIFGIVS